MPHYDEARGLLNGVVLQNATLVADATHASASKTTPVDADELPICDSAASFGLKKLTWANLKATLATWIAGGTLTGAFAALSSKASLVLTSAASIFVQFQTSGSNRWLIGKDGAETGANAGSDLFLYRYTDAGGYAGTAIVINRATGEVLVTNLKATALTAPGGAAFLATSSALTNGAGVGAGTLLTAPVAGNPTKWIGINDNGTIRYIPAW